ncbi:GNAT family N-acetyltransferase [Bifidobacterium callitrichidarum]|uniref:Ribosomal-protein-alanine N-acetyltransferase n=1 Tax=Bifidobacterium callitrichidarum TaxID=2052941 RepID=A0A2U2MZT3_9BIFI|nr:GNAT family N-acetyltransferase [Bifidobacterium callitrichidarum]PWG62446.1 ribosomal-protein-alanine N-acetyltransferase [Bifidobacterium callitrichidarum]
MIADLNELDYERAVAAMRALEVELFGNHAWSEASVRQELTATGRTYVFDIADDGTEETGDTGDASDANAGIVRGFAGYWYDGEDAEIMDVGVGRAYQRKGIARTLMTALIARAEAQGARRMLLEVSVVNEPAIALYHGFGFERIGLRKRYYQPEGIDAYVMALDLKPRVVGFQSATHTANGTDETNTTTPVIQASASSAATATADEARQDKKQERQS